MSTATEMYALYLEAEKAALAGQMFQKGDRIFRPQDLDKIRTARQEWELRVQAETASSQGGSGLYSVADWT